VNGLRSDSFSRADWRVTSVRYMKFPKGKRIERMEKLGNVVDAELYHVHCNCGCHGVAGPIASSRSGP
jgi:hypothetical protein